MRTIILAAVVAAALLTSFESIASALRSLQVTPSGANRAAVRAVTFSLQEELEMRIICDVTLRFEANERIGKRAGAAFGNVTEAAIANCSGEAIFRFLSPEPARPWSITYVSFQGTLPLISLVALEVRGFALLVQLELVYKCLFSGNAQFSGSVIEGRIRSLRSLRTSLPTSVDLRGLVACPRSIAFAAELPLERALTTALI